MPSATNNGISVAPDLQEVTDTDISAIDIHIGGQGFDASHDTLKLEGSVFQALNNDFSASNVTIGGISNLQYTYDSTTHILTLTPLTTDTFTASDIDQIVSSLQFQTSSTSEGDRDFTVTYTDLAGNTSAPATHTITLDNTAPTLTVSTLSMSSDTGSSTTDLVTRIDSQTLSGTLSGNTSAGDTVQVSLDNGATWQTATHTAGTNAFSYAATLLSSNTAQVRVVDAANNTSNTTDFAYVLDTTSVTAVDLSADIGTQNTTSLTVNTSDWATGITIAPALQAPSSTDIYQITLSLGGAGMDDAHELLRVGTNSIALNTDSSNTNQTIAGVTGLDYHYDSTQHQLTLYKNDLSVFDNTLIDDILQSLSIKSDSIANAMTGEHTATISWSDLAGNTADSATVTIDVLPVVQANTISLIQSQLSVSSGETLTANSSTGSFYIDRNNAFFKWSDQQTWALGKTYTSASGSVQLHMLHINSASENAAIVDLQSGSSISGNLFLGGTDVNGDGVWDWQFADNVMAPFYNENSTVTTTAGGANDTTPFGTYTQWNVNEPNGNGFETIMAFNQTGGTWYDWSNINGNNLDAMAELEYARVLNLARTTTAQTSTQSIDVASSTDGTAYLVKSTLNVSTESDITSAASSQWNAVTLTSSILSYEDFNQTPQGWTYNNTASTDTLYLHSQYGLNSVLGRFVNTQEGALSVQKTYDLGLSSGSVVWVEFDMIEMDAWEGQHFNVYINNTQVTSTAYFGSSRSTLDAWDGGIDLGDLSISTNGGNTDTTLREEVHHYALQAVVNNDGGIDLGFGMSTSWDNSTAPLALSHASFAIDNVTLRSNASTSLSLSGLEAGTYVVYTADSSGLLSQNHATGIVIG